MAFPYTQPAPQAAVPQTAPLDPISKESWASLTLLELARILGQPQDQPARELANHAKNIMAELQSYRAVAAAVNAHVK